MNGLIVPPTRGGRGGRGGFIWYAGFNTHSAQGLRRHYKGIYTRCIDSPDYEGIGCTKRSRAPTQSSVDDDAVTAPRKGRVKKPSAKAIDTAIDAVKPAPKKHTARGAKKPTLEVADSTDAADDVSNDAE
ncbi:hypothetical protein B0T24DRAFT_717711 [Lasiosphaeria ovina]|uniref:Uncharacterized protein n=1 Tax=Lasiosphaeria ovina TaxID=92902 RepID=A0AAE0NF03_9PEZI|nr:hypothetical protein B0T24DRAFT_717711 [Lasiosphaeria ovina]